MLVLILTAVAGAGSVMAWMFDRRRSHGRNAAGRCGACGVSWAEPGSGERYLIHGRLVCETCADKARRRMPWELGALTAWAALLSGLAATNIIMDSAKGIGFVIAGTSAFVLVGTVQLMKLANRRAQRRLATEEFAELEAGPGAQGSEPGLPKPDA